jgi:hypothetical protein
MGKNLETGGCGLLFGEEHDTCQLPGIETCSCRMQVQSVAASVILENLNWEYLEWLVTADFGQYQRLLLSVSLFDSLGLKLNHYYDLSATFIPSLHRSTTLTTVPR